MRWTVDDVLALRAYAGRWTTYSRCARGTVDDVLTLRARGTVDDVLTLRARARGTVDDVLTLRARAGRWTTYSRCARALATLEHTSYMERPAPVRSLPSSIPQ